MTEQTTLPGRIFISHCEEDAGIATQLAAALEAAGHWTWYYERDCLPGHSYLIQTGQAIEGSGAFILLISSRSMACSQVTREVVRAHEADRPVIPILCGVTHAQFQQGQPEWREALGSTASIRFESGGVPALMPRILSALKAMGLKSSHGPAERSGAAAKAAIFKIGRCRHSDWTTCRARKSCVASGPEDCGNHVILLDTADIKSHSLNGKLLPGCVSISRRAADLLIYPGRVCVLAKKSTVCLNSETALLPEGGETELKNGDYLYFKATGCSPSKWQCAIKDQDGQIKEVRLVHLGGIAGCSEDGTENAAKEYVFAPAREARRD